MARGTAVATWKKSWNTGVTAAMRPKVTARPESAPAVATSTGVRRRASRAWLLMCLVSQAPPTSATAGPGSPCSTQQVAQQMPNTSKILK